MNVVQSLLQMNIRRMFVCFTAIWLVACVWLFSQKEFQEALSSTILTVQSGWLENQNVPLFIVNHDQHQVTWTIEHNEQLCNQSWQPPTEWSGHEWLPPSIHLYLKEHKDALATISLVHHKGFVAESGSRAPDPRDLCRDENCRQEVARMRLPPRLTWEGSAREFFGGGTTLQSVWFDDEYVDTELRVSALHSQSNISQAVRLAKERSLAMLYDDWRQAIARMKHVFLDAQRHVGKIDWILDEGTLLAALRWGAMWGTLPNFGLDVVDDDIDILVFAQNHKHWMDIAASLAHSANTSGFFGKIDVDPVAENFGWDLCGVLQMSYLQTILVDIKVVLLDEPLACLPCRLHPSAHLSPVCGGAPLRVISGTLHGEDVPLQPLPEAMVQLALHRYWKPDGARKEQASGLILPSKAKGLKKGHRKYSLLDVASLNQSASRLCELGRVSFAPIMAQLPAEVVSQFLPPDRDVHDAYER